MEGKNKRSKRHRQHRNHISDKDRVNSNYVFSTYARKVQSEDKARHKKPNTITVAKGYEYLLSRNNP